MKQQMDQYNQSMMAELKVELPLNVATSPTPSGTATTSPTNTTASKQHNHNSRAPKCTRCRNHGVISDLRGHKHKCYWRDCSCTKCLISSDRQRATADRIALFRQQVRQIAVEDRQQRREKRKYSNDADEDVNYLTPMTRKIPSPNAHPPSLPKMTSSSSTYHCPPPSQYQRRDAKNTRNITDVLRMIFPFYDAAALSSISLEHNYDLLQTVLSISSSLLKKRSSSSSYYRLSPHSPPPPPPPSSFYKMAHASGRCCSSPYCPVNSYLNLRKKSPEIMQHLPTPPLTAVSPSYDHLSRSDGSETTRPAAAPKSKKFRFSTDTELPYCDSCQKFGIKGDKFCPLCGILFSN